MYICSKCHREYQDKPNGRCVDCGGLVRKNLDRTGRSGKVDRRKVQNARNYKRGEEW
jgi:rRNA maturation endonuclease Nob1